jgi:hypothetical protein
MDVKDHTTPLFSIYLANSVAVSDLGAVAISSNGVPTGSDLVGDLGWKNSTNRTVLV